jgi:hypothetical protein
MPGGIASLIAVLALLAAVAAPVAALEVRSSTSPDMPTIAST